MPYPGRHSSLEAPTTTRAPSELTATEKPKQSKAAPSLAKSLSNCAPLVAWRLPSSACGTRGRSLAERGATLYQQREQRADAVRRARAHHAVCGCAELRGTRDARGEPWEAGDGPSEP
ncbi:unnamed protein product [Prorocentrum cordatum]|uniref:Uncharacterized protein n=1 Tax=Prorocentrum cordatum TaxID=2364126 RepID=A0ABN9VZK3_9DINO|nr:unnamed protein product [Polarella glacialis]